MDADLDAIDALLLEAILTQLMAVTYDVVHNPDLYPDISADYNPDHYEDVLLTKANIIMDILYADPIIQLSVEDLEGPYVGSMTRDLIRYVDESLNYQIGFDDVRTLIQPFTGRHRQ
jgi:hypothetical protein